jgi:hypothetical protein
MKLPERMHTWPINLQACSSIRDRLIYGSSTPRLARVQAITAKKGYNAKIALDAAHETIHSMNEPCNFDAASH